MADDDTARRARRSTKFSWETAASCRKRAVALAVALRSALRPAIDERQQLCEMRDAMVAARHLAEAVGRMDEDDGVRIRGRAIAVRVADEERRAPSVSSYDGAQVVRLAPCRLYAVVR
jgi:hypothetical protein